MDSELSEGLASLKQEFTKTPVEEAPSEMEVDLPPTASEPSEPVDVAVGEVTESEFPIPTSPQVAPLHVPIQEPLAAETVKGALAAEEAHRVQTMKLSEFVSWLSEQGGMNDAAKTLSAEMSLAGFAAPSAHDLTLAAAMWSKKNYRGQSAEETVKTLLAESTPVSLRAEIEAFTPFNAEETFSLLSEEKTKDYRGLSVLVGGALISSLVAFMYTRR